MTEIHSITKKVVHFGSPQGTKYGEDHQQTQKPQIVVSKGK